MTTIIQDGDPRVGWRPSWTLKVTFAPECGSSVYLTVDDDEGGRQPFRLINHKGQSGGCQQTLLAGIARLCTLIFQESDIPLERVVHTLIGMQCGQGMYGQVSCLDALARKLKEVYLPKKGEQEHGKPEAEEASVLGGPTVGPGVGEAPPVDPGVRGEVQPGGGGTAAGGAPPGVLDPPAP